MAEADLFTIEPENEMYVHLNINYLQLDQIPSFKNGWQPVIHALQNGKFFSTTGEVLIPSFHVNEKQSGDTATLSAKNAVVDFQLKWTYPMNFAEIISGDGKQVFRHHVNLDSTTSFGEKTFRIPVDLSGRTWVRLEAWDIAANGAFTQTIWLK